MRPLILVTACVRQFERYRWHAAADRYLLAVEVSGGLPLILPSLSALDLDDALARADGVLVTGSRSNVHPTHYGVEETADHPPYDEDRDAVTLELIRRATAGGVPTLCICRGIQELNVAFGGTLDPAVSRTDGRLDHSAPAGDDNDLRFAPTHDVRFEPNSRLGAIVGSDTARVNSLHGQGIRDLAPGLSVEARASDGTVEAVRVEGAPAFAYGVQWHPEYWAASDPPSKAILGTFVAAARERMAAR